MKLLLLLSTLKTARRTDSRLAEGHLIRPFYLAFPWRFVRWAVPRTFMEFMGIQRAWTLNIPGMAWDRRLTIDDWRLTTDIAVSWNFYSN